MLDNLEKIAAPKKSELFIDWQPYRSLHVAAQLPKDFKYTFPSPNPQVRERILRSEKSLQGNEGSILRQALKFLEMGMVEDGFGSNDKVRNHVLHTGEILVDGKKMYLSDFVHMVNKLPGGALADLMTFTGMAADEVVRKKTGDLVNIYREIRSSRDYFIPKDLPQFDELARLAIDRILGKYE